MVNPKYRKRNLLIKETKKKMAPFSDLTAGPKQAEDDSLEQAMGGLSLKPTLDPKKVVSLSVF